MNQYLFNPFIINVRKIESKYSIYLFISDNLGSLLKEKSDNSNFVIKIVT